MKTSASIGIVCAVLLSSPRPTEAQRRPYLQLGTESSMTIVWETADDSPTAVCYGARPDALINRAGVGSGRSHQVRVEDLSPGTQYFYSVGDASCPPTAAGSPEMYFRTTPPRGSHTPFRFWVVGDSGTGDAPQRAVRDAMLEAAGSNLPDIYLHVGDMAYQDGTTREFTDHFFTIYEDILQNTVCWPTIGNHEGHESTSRTESGPYYEAYVLPRNGEAGGLASGTEAYYAVDHANVHFIILDSYGSDLDIGGPMLDWLEMDLAATDQEWVIAYWHHPPYSKGGHDSDEERRLIIMRENASRILEENGVDLIFTGHSHIYERSFLVHGAYDTPTTAEGHIVDSGDGRLDGDGAYRTRGDGAVYIVAGHGGRRTGGTGGHPLMYFTEIDHGSVLADVNGPMITLRNIRHDGEETDYLTLVKGEGLFLSSPRAGDVITAGATTEIAWASTGTTTAVRLDFSLDGGTTWEAIVDRTENDGLHPWTTPAQPSMEARVRIVDVDDASVTDTTEMFALVDSSTPVPTDGAMSPTGDSGGGPNVPDPHDPTAPGASGGEVSGGCACATSDTRPPLGTMALACVVFARIRRRRH